jgi:arylsulfatase A-like enzyme
LHGFDEFFGYLYHLDAMEDPCHRNYPPALKATVGPRNMIHTWATNVDDQTEQPRCGKVGKQKIEDAGELCPKRMETVDDEILSHALAFVDKARKDGKPFFLWLNPTRMHVFTHLSEKYEAMRTPENGWSISEAGHGAARRHRRRGDAEGEGPRHRERYDPRLHHRQWGRELQLA